MWSKSRHRMASAMEKKKTGTIMETGATREQWGRLEY